jgi:hypothetical protein
MRAVQKYIRGASHVKKELRFWLGLVGALGLLGASVTAAALEPDELSSAALANARQLHVRGPVNAIGATKVAAGLKTGSSNSGVPGIDSLVNFTGQYRANGVDSSGNPVTEWSYAMVGHSPRSEEGVTLRAPVIAVSMDLRDQNGQVRHVNGHRLYSDGTQYVQPVLQSPIFQNFWYSSSSQPTQFTDAVQRAEFWGDDLENDWHTLLAPVVGDSQVMQLSQDPACGTSTNGVAGHCNYFFKLDTDGRCCAYILVDANVFNGALFPPTFPVDNTTIVGAAELNGDMTTQDVSTFLFPNTFLYLNGDPKQCCVLGFHTFDFEPGVASNGNVQRFYVMNYSAWISPGLFGPNFTDITAVSHELSEIFNDPFVVFDGVTNLTPWWLSPNGNCQNDLEVGDVVEGLPNATFPITMHGFTYHPQNEALLPWFEFQKRSSAIGGAYSYPDASVITALSAPQKVNCAP